MAGPWKYPDELREQAIRLVLDAKQDPRDQCSSLVGASSGRCADQVGRCDWRRRVGSHASLAAGRPMGTQLSIRRLDPPPYGRDGPVRAVRAASGHAGVRCAGHLMVRDGGGSKGASRGWCAQVRSRQSRHEPVRGGGAGTPRTAFPQVTALRGP